MGFSKGVKSCVIACSKKVKSKAPGFFKGVARISVRCVKACSRKLKSKTPKAVPECEACCKRAKETSCKACLKIKKEASKERPKQFTHFTLDVPESKTSWPLKLKQLLNEVAGIDGVRSCVYDKQKRKIEVSTDIDQDKFLKRIEKFLKSGDLGIDHFQFGKCSGNYYRKKEAPKITNPSTNNANTAVGYYPPQGYGSYYGNGGYNNAGMYGNGGYYNYIPYNGGYNGITYNYQPEPAVYQRRIGYDHIDCAGGDASECCSGHHIDKSSEKTAPKPAA